MRDATLVGKNMLSRKLRLVLTVLGIFTAFLLFGVLASIASVGERPTGPAAQRLVVMNKINFTQPLPIAHVERAAGVEGVAAATHSTWFGGYFREPRNFLIAMAIDPANYFAVYPEIRLVPEQRAAFLRDRTSIIIGDKVADRFGWRVGEVVPLQSSIYQSKDGARNWNMTIAGIFTSSSEAQANSVLMHFAYLNDRRTSPPDLTGQITVLAEDAAAPDDVAARIDRAFAGDFYETDTVGEDQFSTMFLRQLGDIRMIMTVVIGASFLSILMMTANTMVISVRERTKQIAVLRTIGFPAGRVTRLLVAEALAISLIGGLLGLLTASAIVAGLSNSGALAGAAMNGIIWLAGLAGIVVLGLATSVIPVRMAYRQNIVSDLQRR